MNSRVWLIAKTCFLDVVRHKVVSIHFIFVLVALLLINLFRHFSLSPNLEFRLVQDVGISIVGLFGLFMTLFVGVSTLREELNRKTLYATLTLPMARWELYAGKFIGTLLATMLNTLVMMLIFSVAIYFRFQLISYGMLWIVLFMALEFAIIAALVLLFSLTDSTVLAFSCTLFLVILGNLSTYITHLIEETGSQVFIWAGKVAFLIIPNLALFNVKARFLKSAEIPLDLVAWAGGYCLVYMSIVVLVGMWCMERRDL